MKEVHTTIAIAFDEHFFVNVHRSVRRVKRGLSEVAIDGDLRRKPQLIAHTIDCALKVFDGAARPAVHRVIEHGVIKPGGKKVATGDKPILFLVNVRHFGGRDLANATFVQALVTTIGVIYGLRYALVRCAAGVFRMIDETAFVRQRQSQRWLKGLVRHTITLACPVAMQRP